MFSSSYLRVEVDEFNQTQLPQLGDAVVGGLTLQDQLASAEGEKVRLQRRKFGEGIKKVRAHLDMGSDLNMRPEGPSLDPRLALEAMPELLLLLSDLPVVDPASPPPSPGGENSAAGGEKIRV